ncbi:hypothetical protein RCZ04_17560 [Capnocytophaga sp. HP1101]
MKRILYLTMLFIVIACSENTKEDEKPDICCSPPPTFFLLVNKNSELYKDFINEKGEVDKEHISLYKEENNQKKLYGISFRYTNIPKSEVEYLWIETQLGYENDVYTGETETLYLQNASKTHKIELKGAMESHNHCCPTANLKEMSIDGVKVENYFLAK